MILAIPILGEDIAPRFCSADQFIIVDTDDNGGVSGRLVALADEPWHVRLRTLSEEGVTILLCNGFNHRFLPAAEGHGIQVISGLAGKVEQLVAAYATDELERFRFVPSTGRDKGRGHRRGWRGRQGRS